MPATPHSIALSEAENVMTGEDTLTVYKLDTMGNLPPPEWLIQNFLERYGLTQVAGREKTGKSTFVLDILLSWMSGQDSSYLGDEDGFRYMADPVDHKVLYCLLEGQNSVYYRAKAWADAHGVASLPENFYIMPNSMNLHKSGCRVDDMSTWSQGAQQLYHTVQELEPTIVVVDTFSRATPGINENSSEMAAVVGIFDKLRDDFGVTVVVVHHTAKMKGSISRGHSSLQDAQNVHVTLERVSETDKEQGVKVILGPNRNSGMEGVRPYTLRFEENERYNAAYMQKGARPKKGKATDSAKEWFLDNYNESEGLTYDAWAQLAANKTSTAPVSKTTIGNWIKEVT